MGRVVTAHQVLGNIMGTMIVGMFMDDFGNEVYPYLLASFMSRYYFYKEYF